MSAATGAVSVAARKPPAVNTSAATSITNTVVLLNVTSDLPYFGAYFGDSLLS